MPSASPPPEPILASWKIHDVLRRYPALLDDLANLSPAFRQLRNPLTRQIQARLVTVAHAAEIAGLEPTELVRALNAAIGATKPVDAPSVLPDRVASEPAWARQAQVAAELDARPALQRGEEPFAAIMRAAGDVAEGQVFRLRAPFEPLPLFDVLAKRGFAHWSRQLGSKDWEILFRNEGSPHSGVESRPANPPARRLDWDAPGATVIIDVSELVPPEPFVKILEALERLPPGETLHVHHVRRPVHLYPRLDEMGCRHETREPAQGRVELLIQKPAPGSEDAA